MLDIVEIALDTITDFLDFEKLATEVLYLEGYSDVKPLGGTHDFGQDAVSERLYERTGRRARIVFQITTQEALESKLRSTVGRLDDAKIEFSKLVIVTSNKISTERQRHLSLIAKDLDIQLEIIDRSTISNRISDLTNGIFARHFPDVRRQIEVLYKKQSDTIAPVEVFKSVFAFTANHASSRARDDLVHDLILALVLQERDNASTIADVQARHRRLLPEASPLEASQVQAHLHRMVTEGFIRARPDGYHPTEKAKEMGLSSQIDWRVKGGLLAADVGDMVEQAMDSELDSGQRGLIERNARDAIGIYFRTMGVELTSVFIGGQGTDIPSLTLQSEVVSTATRQLPREIGLVTIAALAELFARPNDEQAASLRSYAYGFLGAALVEVDPAVRELRASRLREKVFLLDTDFLLDCIIPDRPGSAANMVVVNALIGSQARIVIPEECIGEVSQHEGTAFRTVNYFGEGIFGLSEVQAREQINNAFALGWYFRSLVEEVSFNDYIRNFYERTNPYGFMKMVIETSMPDGAEIGNPVSLLEGQLDKEQVDQLASELLDLVKSAPKSVYRTEEETLRLAQTDAELYTACYALQRQTNGTSRVPLHGACYLITSSSRFMRAVPRAWRVRDEISARPAALAGMMEISGQSSLSTKEFVSLFDNPFLQHVVAESRTEVNALLQAGLSARHKSLPRLVWDLNDDLHNRVSETLRLESSAIASTTEADDVAFDRSYFALVEAAGERDFRPLPSTRRLLREMENLRKENASLEGRVEELQSSLEDANAGMLERRRQRHLNRVRTRNEGLRH